MGGRVQHLTQRLEGVVVREKRERAYYPGWFMKKGEME